MTLPDFHTFREMLEHLSTGGAAYRYGSAYPIYVGGKPLIVKRTWGGSSGELTTSGYADSGVAFTLEEQQSTNWVLISKADWEARDRAMRESYEEHQRIKCQRINAANAAAAEQSEKKPLTRWIAAFVRWVKRQ